MKRINEPWLLIVLMLVFTTFSCSDDDEKETKFEVNKTALTLEVEDSEQLSIIIKSSATSNNEISWKSEDEKIATVSDKGKVTAVAVGDTRITVTVNGVAAIIKVTVIAPIKITAIKVNKTAVTLETGKTELLSVTIEPTNASIKRVSWKSNDEKVATVSNKGLVKAIAAGVTTITATADGISAVTEVTVNEPLIKVTEVKINKAAVTLEAGESEQLSVTIEPSDASDKQVLWTSGNTGIATVSEEGLVTAVAAGVTTITATVGGISAEAEITVNESVIKVTEVNINKTAITLETGKSEQLSVTIEPSNASDKQVLWTSSNTGIATVSEEGLVTAVAAGVTTITATVDGISAEAVVTVNAPFSIIGEYMGKVTAFEGGQQEVLAENVLLTLVNVSENTINVSTEINLDGLSIPINGKLSVSKQKDFYNINGDIPVTVNIPGFGSIDVTATIVGTINTEGIADLKISVDMLGEDSYFVYGGKKK